MPSNSKAKYTAIGIFIVSLAIIGIYRDNPSLILPVVGIASFAIPIVLSFDDEYNLGTRLDNGEVRKSIAIALTVVYIIMLTLFFINVTLPQPQGNASTEKDQNNASGLATGKTTLILPFIQPAAAEVQSASTNEEINDSEELGDAAASSSGSEKIEGGDDAGKETGETDKSKNPLMGEIPDSALADIYKNFLYVYILIIGFYFGSRVFEDFAAVRMTKALTGSDPRDLLKMRFAMGEISEDDYNERIEALICSDPNDLLKVRLAKGEIGPDYYRERVDLLKKQ